MSLRSSRTFTALGQVMSGRREERGGKSRGLLSAVRGLVLFYQQGHRMEQAIGSELLKWYSGFTLDLIEPQDIDIVCTVVG